MNFISRKLTVISAALGALTLLTAQAAVITPDRAAPKPQDLGALEAQTAAAPMSVTLALRLPNLDAAESLLKSLHTPGDAQFHRFLSADEFIARFAPAPAEVARIATELSKYGLQAERTTATTLKVTGTAAALQRAFQVSLHNFGVAAHGTAAAYTFHAPLSRPAIPAAIAASVAAVAGFDTRPSLRPHVRAASMKHAPIETGVVPAATINPPGALTVTDFVGLYDVQPLYDAGVTGKGRTLGILTFASFTPSDAFAYWSSLGLTVNANRIRIVNVDGGPGAPSDASGSIETTLDVEQSGGIAPGAKIIVYQGPNTNQAFVDVFASAIDANTAQTLSVSWGNWEWDNNLENAPVIDPISGKTVGTTQAVHELLVRAAIQGQTTFAASGDGGAYDINHDLGCLPPGVTTGAADTCTETLSVDYPGSDPAITAAGGTTLPGLQSYCLNASCIPPYYYVTIANESVWGWDYLDGLCTALGFNPFTCGIFPAGSGGGVSILFRKPVYQEFLAGVQRSQPNQTWVFDGALLYTLPANFAGRNVPDVSFNADPDTGYAIYYTSDVSGFGVLDYYGGTSFVAPQLNGVSALLGQSIGGHRIGLLNYPLYGVGGDDDVKTPAAPFVNPIAYGDNWFYSGTNGYNPAAGLGTLDVANFAKSPLLHRDD